jgi:hypothetical protein
MLSAPIRKAMNNALNEVADVMKPCKIDYRKEECYYLFPEKTQVAFTCDVNFNEAEDIALARIFLLELADTKR